MPVDWSEFEPEAASPDSKVDWSEFQPEPDRDMLRKSLQSQMTQARIEAEQGKATGALLNIGAGISHAIAQAGAKADPTMVVANMLSREGYQPTQLVSPEILKPDLSTIGQFGNEVLGNLGLPQVPPEVSEPVKEFAAENIAALPEIAPQMVLGAFQPKPVARMFQGQVISGLVPSVQALQTAETPQEMVKAGLQTGAASVFPSLIEHGVAKAERVLPKSAKALEETSTAKGEEIYAPQERIIEESSQPEHLRTEAQRLPAETGYSNRPESGAEVKPEEVPNAEERSQRVLLTPEERTAAQKELAAELESEAKPSPSLPEKAAEAPPLEAVSASEAKAQPVATTAGELQPAISEATTEPPISQGPGGASLGGESARGQGSPTAMKYALIDQERQQRGLEPLVKPESVSDKAVMDKAMSYLDKNPEGADILVQELLKKPRAIQDWENHVLLLRKIDLRDQYYRSAREAAQAYEDSKQFPERLEEMRAANARTEQWSQKLSELEQASRLAGSERGRALRALRVMANEDYSLAALELQRRTDQGWKDLSPEEAIRQRKQLEGIADRWKKAEDVLASVPEGTEKATKARFEQQKSAPRSR